MQRSASDVAPGFEADMLLPYVSDLGFEVETVQSDEGLGTCFVAVLPRYDVDDYLEKEADPTGAADASN
ncbi:MAG: hypothetical protein AB7O59_24290 [Pirellulales bacterium]